jgi:hypothetical protein
MSMRRGVLLIIDNSKVELLNYCLLINLLVIIWWLVVYDSVPGKKLTFTFTSCTLLHHVHVVFFYTQTPHICHHSAAELIFFYSLRSLLILTV